MGFGYLFLGFVILMNPVYSEYSDWLAFVLMLAGLMRLSVYNKGFRHALFIGYAGCCLGFLQLILTGLSGFGIIGYADNSALYFTVNTAALIVGAAFCLELLSGIYMIAKETGLEKQKLRAAYYIAVYLLVLVFRIMLFFGLIGGEDGSAAVVLGAELLAGLLIALLIFSCYRLICLEGDEDMPDKPKKQKKTSSHGIVTCSSSDSPEADKKEGKRKNE